MKKKQKTRSYWPVMRIILLMLGLFLLPIVIFFAVFEFRLIKDSFVEKRIERNFYKEVAMLPQITLKSFRLWEGDSMATISIKDKGEVYFWYGIGGVPTIERIGEYGTSFECFYVDSRENKVHAAYSTGLSLGQNGQFTPWFPFEVNSLSDLVEKYDQIIAILQTFPHNPPVIEHKDSWGLRYVLKNPDPKFILKTTHKGRQVQCDLFTTQILF